MMRPKIDIKTWQRPLQRRDDQANGWVRWARTGDPCEDARINGIVMRWIKGSVASEYVQREYQRSVNRIGRQAARALREKNLETYARASAAQAHWLSLLRIVAYQDQRGIPDVIRAASFKRISTDLAARSLQRFGVKATWLTELARTRLDEPEAGEFENDIERWLDGTLNNWAFNETLDDAITLAKWMRSNIVRSSVYPEEEEQLCASLRIELRANLLQQLHMIVSQLCIAEDQRTEILNKFCMEMAAMDTSVER